MQRYVIVALVVGVYKVNGVVSLITTTTMNYTLPRIILNDFFENDRQLLTSPQVHGPCLGKQSRNDFSCSLTLEPRRPKVSPDRSFTCDFNVSLPSDPALNCDIVQSRAATIASEKALLIITQGCVHNLYVLQFSNCTAAPIEYSYRKSIRACTWGFTVQVPPENTTENLNERLFDVLLDGPTRVMFGRLIYSSTLSEQSYNYPMLPNANLGNAFLYTPTKGRVFVVLDAVWRQNEWGLRIFTADDNGSNRTLKEYKFPELTRIYTSAMRELLTTCVGFNETTMNCAQFDSDGDMKFEVDVPYMTWIYNLAGGGFNSITRKCLDDEYAEYLEFCPADKRAFTVTKINRTGRAVGSLKVPRFNCKRSPYIQFVEDENGELCFSQKCPDDYAYEYVSLQTICFDDDDYVIDKLN